MAVRAVPVEVTSAVAQLRGAPEAPSLGSRDVLADELELTLITYNRADALARTLEQLATSPFAACRLTVLDNCSTDGTAGGVRGLRAERFPELRVVRHARNIGAEANYLRALETMERPYGWVLCDDDDLDFSDCDDVIAAIWRARSTWSPSGRPRGRTGRAGGRR